MPKRKRIDIIETPIESNRAIDAIIINSLNSLREDINNIREDIKAGNVKLDEYKKQAETNCSELHKPIDEFINKKKEEEAEARGKAAGKAAVKNAEANEFDKKFKKLAFWEAAVCLIVGIFSIWGFIDTKMNKRMSYREWQQMQAQMEKQNQKEITNEYYPDTHP